MDLFFDKEMPAALKALVFLAVAVAAIVSIWKNLRGNLLLHLIAKEMSPNGGESVKDKVNAAADDSKVALVLTKKLNRKVTSLRAKQTEMLRRLELTETTSGQFMEHLRQAQGDIVKLKEQFDRYMLHEARGDLQRSQLVKDLEKLVPVPPDPENPT